MTGSTTSTKLEMPKVVNQRTNSTKHRISGPIPVVDLFAGPGGLGEGFSSLGAPDSPKFKIAASAEMNGTACQTLRLRAYFRALQRTSDPALLKPYYDYCLGLRAEPFIESTHDYWMEAESEALNIELGTARGNRDLNARLRSLELRDTNWVLTGGPPCQAYSRVGRARNRGKLGYSAENDKRFFLYKQYVRVVKEFQPAVFVMENVEGLLSATLKSKSMIRSILRSLVNRGYRVHSLVSPQFIEKGSKLKSFDPRIFLVRAEDYGVPQARHRVFLLGVREDITKLPTQLVPLKNRTSLAESIGSLPKLRSSLSREPDSDARWAEVVRQAAADLCTALRNSDHKELHAKLERIARSSLVANVSERQYPKNETALPEDLANYLRDESLLACLNHEPRSHMASDLRRYLYAAAFALVNGRSPRGQKDFNVRGLAPAHRSWREGSFADRFRVQVSDRPSTTITSHIAKDGHYFIHPDPLQCRSLTVREAARLQTFPDNYFFCGGRTEQYSQVGNAVPPYLARQIAEIVHNLLTTT